jgi:hypothetical protein
MHLEFFSLNKLMIKDNVSIEVVDDFLDELHVAKFFSKLDLLSSYHQIWTQYVDIPKMVICTNEIHYEFLVMHFGLCNAPSTFQSLMSKLFIPFLCNFLLVFFDDLLIYSHNLGRTCGAC